MDFYALLRPYGWNESFHSAALSSGAGPELVPARIMSEERSEYAIFAADQKFQRAELTGSYRYENQTLPTVGDWALGTPMPGTNRLRITHLLPRKSLLQRKIAGTEKREQLLAANVDYALLVAALPDDLNLARLERYLALVRDGGVEPIVVITKADLVENPESFREEVLAIAGATEVLLTSCQDGRGIETLRTRLGVGDTSVLLGSSGVGKSTLVNALAGENTQATGAIRDDGRGRHTTTARTMLPLKSGALLIDTPGLREVGLWIEGEGLENTFADIAELARNCRFNDCRHESEPGCAVTQAIADGDIDPDRLLRLRRLEREENYQARKQDRSLAAAEKKKWKNIGKANRERQRWKSR